MCLFKIPTKQVYTIGHLASAGENRKAAHTPSARRWIRLAAANIKTRALKRKVKKFKLAN